MGVFYFGYIVDLIYIGICNGVIVFCLYGGYVLEIVCYIGMECVYDMVVDKGWCVGIGMYKI